MERRFTGFFIPSHIIENANLNWTDRIILAEIDALNINNNGCFAFNKHFCELLNVDERTVSRSISKLASFQLLKIENPASKNRKLFANYAGSNAKQPRQKCRGNIDKNVGVTQTPLSGSHIYITEITNESLPLPPQRGEERPVLINRKSYTDTAVDVNSEKANFTVEEKKQRLNEIGAVLTIKSDFMEFAQRRLSVDRTEVLRLVKKFLDTIAADDTCYDSIGLIRRRCTAYIIKMKEKAA